MKHYQVKVVDGYSAKSVYLHFYGKLSSVTINGKSYQTIVNEYDVPLYIAGLNTVSIIKF